MKKITKMVLEDARAKAEQKTASAPPREREPVLAGVGAEAPPTVGEPQVLSAAAPETSPAVPMETVAPQTAPAAPTAAAEPETPQIRRERSLKVRGHIDTSSSPNVHRAQKSLRVRRKRKSFFARLFGWFFGQ